MFIDIAHIEVCGGKGGDGCVSFHREKYVAAGGPDGGNGGRGGDCVLIVDPSMSTLMDFRYKRKYAAQGGVNGSGKNCTGADADPLLIKVPRGTIVRDDDTGRIIADLSENNARFVVAAGGRGGAGNAHFATPRRQTPNFAKPGKRGRERRITLELRLIADVGLIGFPNVGKSTLLSVLTNARPRIANYHFTTLSPNLGVLRVYDSDIVLADLPGIIEGAAEGVGLGQDFLRHASRTRLLLHLVDASQCEGRDAVQDFLTIQDELSRYGDNLPSKAQIVVGSKCDVSTEHVDRLAQAVQDAGYPFIPISSVARQGVDELIRTIHQMLQEIEKPVISVEEDVAQTPGEINIVCEGGVYYITGEWAEDLIYATNFTREDSLGYFQRALRLSGVIDRLTAMGIQEGDTVDMCGVEFDFWF